MEKLNKKAVTMGFVSLLALTSIGFICLLFKSHYELLNNDIARLEKSLAADRVLLAKKTALQAEWDEKKRFISIGLEPEAVLSAWVKDILAMAQLQALTMDKLEPAGVKTGEKGKRLTLFVSFQGDLRKCIQFIYALNDKDPLANVESFQVRQDEAGKTLSFELMLSKVVK